MDYQESVAKRSRAALPDDQRADRRSQGSEEKDSGGVGGTAAARVKDSAGDDSSQHPGEHFSNLAPAAHFHRVLRDRPRAAGVRDVGPSALVKAAGQAVSEHAFDQAYQYGKRRL